MSVVGSEYGGSSYGRSEPRPDKPLVVKCLYEERGGKKISYPSARICSFDNLRKQVRFIRLNLRRRLGCILVKVAAL